MLNGKNILLGITGGIAAYKTTFLVRLFIKAGANVKVILTDSASSFVSPLTLATLSKNPVVTDFVKSEANSVDWNNHVELGLWADLMLVAPATANTMSKMASGGCDNLLLASYLSAKCPIFFAPAMDLDMYKHPSTVAFNTNDEDDISLIKVVSADEMYTSAHENYADSDIVICAAAVADYRPKIRAEQKIKKSDKELSIDLVKNKDILLSLGKAKKGQYLVGFALETENEIDNAKGKLRRKNLDAIVLNSLNDKGAGFGGTTNKISFIDTNLEIQTFELKTKAAVAKDILNEIIKRRYA